MDRGCIAFAEAVARGDDEAARLIVRLVLGYVDCMTALEILRSSGEGRSRGSAVTG